MTRLIQLWLGPVAVGAAIFLAAMVAMARENGRPGGIKVLAAKTPDRQGRNLLDLIHPLLIIIAAVLASSMLRWWEASLVPGLARLGVTVLSIWVAGTLLPRLFIALAPEWSPPAAKLVQPLVSAIHPLLVKMERLMAVPHSRLLDLDNEEMLHGVFALGEMTVAEVMTPRLDLTSVDVGMDEAAVVRKVKAARHSRLLVVDGDPDNVAGVLHARELLEKVSGDSLPGSWRSLVRPVNFAPEGKRLDRQLREFQHSPNHLVVVVDEFGGTAGVVTLEDIVEQVVGEIQDESDTDEVAPITTSGPAEWLVQGGVSLIELEEALDTGLGREDVNTVGGLVQAELGRVARIGDSVELAGFRFQVDQVVRRRIRRVTVTKLAVQEVSEGVNP